MALGIMAWGEDHVSATSELGVPVVAAVVEPRADDETAPGGRSRGAAPRRDRVGDPHLRPAQPRRLIAAIPAPGVSALAHRPDRRPAHRGLRRRPCRDARPRGDRPERGRRGRRRPSPIGQVADAVDLLFVTTDGDDRHGRLGRPSRLVDLATGSVVGGRRPARARRTSPTAATGATLVATTASFSATRPRRRPSSPSRWAGMRPTTRPSWAPATPTVLLGNPGHERDPREGREGHRRRQPARHRDPGRRPDRGRDRRRASRSSTGPRRRSSRPSGSTAAPTAWPRRPASTTRSCT